jgi:hypothetical protein
MEINFMAYNIPLRQVFRQSSLMNCWFYAAKTIVYHRTNRLLFEGDYMDLTLGPLPPTRFIEGRITGRGSHVAHWLIAGLPATHVPAFCELFGFSEPARRAATWTADELEQILRDCGPLYFAGGMGQWSHALVISGIDSSQNVHFSDPAFGRMASDSLTLFNEWKRQIYRLPNGSQLSLMNPLYYPLR